MSIASTLGGVLTSIGFRIASLTNAKARRIMQGRRETTQRLRDRLDPERPTLWMHVASLGEFEQGRPLIEAIRMQYPSWQILVSFFSPSGYEVRYDYAGADCVVYLPNDTPWRVREFLDSAHPDKAIFVKYDLWPGMLEELHRRGVPTYLVSAIFRPSQLFFRPWGWWYRELLHRLDYIWVQDEASRALLAEHGVYHVDVAGDTRFDRADAIARAAQDIPEVDRLRQRYERLLIVGSSWEADEALFIPYLNAHPELGAVIAPHEIDERHLSSIEQALERPSIRLSQIEGDLPAGIGIIIVDSFGLLASIYRYADVVYIGGGFGRGIHNTVEAAVYGVPIVFGPRYHKFREAKLLLQAGAATSIETAEELSQRLSLWLSDEGERARVAQSARQVVDTQLGATDIILRSLELHQDKR